MMHQDGWAVYPPNLGFVAVHWLFQHEKNAPLRHAPSSKAVPGLRKNNLLQIPLSREFALCL